MNIQNLIIKTFEHTEPAPAYLDADAQQNSRITARPRACPEVICA